MNRKLSILILMLLPAISLWAQTEKSFPQFTWVTPASEQAGDWIRFGYDKSSFTLINKDCRHLPANHPCYSDKDYADAVLLGEYKNKSMSGSLFILFSPGPSADPQFAIFDKNNNLLWGENGEEMCINSNGVIYLSGNANRMFNQRTKWQLSNGKVSEVKQPFYYVNVKGKLLKPVKLYSQKGNKGDVVATLPVGYEIEILLGEPELVTDGGESYVQIRNYLARSAFGLVGWLRLRDEDMSLHNPIVRGLGFMGD